MLFSISWSSPSVREASNVPERPHLQSILEEQIMVCQAALGDILDEVTSVPSSPEEWLELEAELHRKVARSVVDSFIGVLLQAAHQQPGVLEAVGELIARTPNLRMQKSAQPVTVTLLGGSTVTLETPYMLRRPPRGPGRPRGRGKRGRRGNGVYPVLAVLGIHYRISPALASEVARHVAIGTVEQARETLLRRGVELDLKAVSRLTQRLAERGLRFREWLVEHATAPEGGPLKGKRVVIGMDGGRVRTRVTKDGRRRKSGHHGFHAPWREPKVLVIYVVNEKGRRIKTGFRYYDATLADADGFFHILTGILRALGAAEASEWIIVGDGAPWIWDRIPGLKTALEYFGEVTEVVDIYHAKQRLHRIASEVKRWSTAERDRWLQKTKKLLRTGKLEDLQGQLNGLCKGRNAKTIGSLIEYFVTNEDRMRYSHFESNGVPLGSGAVESCVRRLVNLRLKGNGIFWTPQNAEGLLHLRGQLLAGRWDRYVAQILTPEAFWLPASSVRAALGTAA